jgi:hypothetical protein
MATPGGGPNWAVPPQQQVGTSAQQPVPQQQGGYEYPHQQAPPAQQPPQGGYPPQQQGVKVVTPPPSGGVPNLHSNNRLARMEDKVLVTRTADEETEDGRIRNKEAMAKIRDAWVYKQVRARVDEFTEYKQVRTVYFYYTYITYMGNVCRLSLER